MREIENSPPNNRESRGPAPIQRRGDPTEVQQETGSRERREQHARIPIAQRTEQPAYTRQAVGSTPTGDANPTDAKGEKTMEQKAPEAPEAPESLDRVLYETLQRKLKSLTLPKNTARVQAAHEAYQAGWNAAVDVAGDRPDTHPADRHPFISEQRLERLLEELQWTGYGWLSGTEYDLRNTCRKYARMGCRDSVSEAADLGWKDFLEANPDQATPEMLARREKALEDIYLYGSTDIFTGKGLTYMPKTEHGNRWMHDHLPDGTIARPTGNPTTHWSQPSCSP